MVTLNEVVLFLSYTIGYLIVNTIDNLLLNVYKKGTKFRWSINPVKPFLSAKKAKILAVLQFLIPFGLALIIDDYISSLLEITIAYIIPIIMWVIASIYATIIQDLPYNVTRGEKAFIIALYMIGILIVYLTYTANPYFCELFPTCPIPPEPTNQ
jgi:hypothetical protein